MPQDLFESYEADKAKWISLGEGSYYPDYVNDAVALYLPVFQEFYDLISVADSSADLLVRIMNTKDIWLRIQLCRVFKKFVSPQTPVEMLKVKRNTATTIAEFGGAFRPINEVRTNLIDRPTPDESLAMVMWEYKDRGKSGYDLSQQAFALLRAIDVGYVVTGPERAGKDILLGDHFDDYPKPDRPVDFMIKSGEAILAIGLVRFDSDRGGAQEDDRTGQYREVAHELEQYSATNESLATTKLVFVNDGPGLLLGSMWKDYSHLERQWAGRAKVVTLKMIPSRITHDWLVG